MADHLDVIAESYRGIHEGIQVIAHATVETQATQRLALRVQVFALTLLGLALLTAALLGWAVLTNTQTIAAQTQAILTTIQRPPTP